MKSVDRKTQSLFLSLALLTLVLTWPKHSSASWLVQPGISASLTDVGGGLGGSFGINLRGYWLPVPEVGLGLEIGSMFPLPMSGQNQDQALADAVLYAGPSLILRFGNESAWGFVRAGLRGSESISSEVTEPALLACLGGGFVVAPRTLPFYFGFELDGKMEVLGDATVRSIGLGGFVGFSL